MHRFQLPRWKRVYQILHSDQWPPHGIFRNLLDSVWFGNIVHYPNRVQLLVEKQIVTIQVFWVYLLFASLDWKGRIPSKGMVSVSYYAWDHAALLYRMLYKFPLLYSMQDSCPKIHNQCVLPYCSSLSLYNHS